MIEDFLPEIQEKIANHETGRLEVKNLKKQETPWSIYFALGRMIWATGGEAPNRLLYLQIKKHCPHVVENQLLTTDNLNWNSPSVDYDLVCQLFHTESIKIKQLVAVQQEMLVQVLFNISQVFQIQREEGSEYGNNSGLQWQWFPQVRPEKYTPIPPGLELGSERTLKLVQEKWDKWQKAGLEDCLPNKAPVMTDAESIKQATAAKTFKNLQRLLNGQRTLQEIALETKRDLIPIAKVLWGYYQKGWVEFRGVPDFNLKKLLVKQPATAFRNSSATTANSQQKKFVVACVDDSPQVTQTMEGILKENGYDCISINDPLRASATLLKAKPDLIFLDLIMPNTNGYEICTQLRRVSRLQEIPIIILTGKDGLIDRMRAKMVGSTQYISKPVDPNTILETVRKYLPTSDKNSSVNSNLSSATAEA